MTHGAHTNHRAHIYTLTLPYSDWVLMDWISWFIMLLASSVFTGLLACCKQVSRYSVDREFEKTYTLNDTGKSKQ